MSSTTQRERPAADATGETVRSRRHDEGETTPDDGDEETTASRADAETQTVQSTATAEAVGAPTETHRWRGVVAVSLTVAAAGLLAQRHELLLLATVGVVYATYHNLTPTPSPELSLVRSVSDSHPADGDEVEVTVTVGNDGDATLADCRVFDGVPPALGAVDGAARRGMMLRPGDQRSFTYTLEARHGKHTFDPASVVVRDPSGDRELELEVAADEAVELDCTTPLSNAPVRSQTLDTVGNITGRGTGSGIEFAQTREYRHGDSPGRVDWKRYAATGELTTIEFQKEQAASVLVVVDARESSYRSAPGQTHGVDAGVSAAHQLLAALQRDRNHVGLAAFGSEDCFLAPGSGREHRIRMRERLSTHPAFSSVPTGDDPPLDGQVDRLLERLTRETQVVVCSPVCDDDVVDAARRLDAHGHRVTVVSPDVTGGETAGERLAAVERKNRLYALRQSDIPVVEWSLDVPLALAVDAAMGVNP